VLIVKTTGDTPISDYALGVLREWGVGQKKTNNGLVMVVATEDRKVWVSVGYGLEGALNDAKIGAILDRYVTPKFREGKYGEGIYDGLEAMRKAIGGEYAVGNDGAPAGGGNSDWWIVLLVFLLFFGICGLIIYLGMKYGRFGGRGRWGRGSWGGGGWSGGGGGFGGGGFGGGSGGGGGAGRGW